MLGIIGGSGLYNIEGLGEAKWVTVTSPWGKPSDQILVGRLHNVPVAFLPRHGRGHIHPPTDVPYRANVDALKRLGCTDLLAVSAVGSLRADFKPGHFVVVDQYIDRTYAREKSYFGPGCVAHVSLAYPTCQRLSTAVRAAATSCGTTVHSDATYLAMEGPQFSTLAESRLYRSWGADVIGMTGMPEAKLAREAELCYASLSMVTDFDCWHSGHSAVEVSDVLKTLASNASAASSTVNTLSMTLPNSREICPHGCDHALSHALITAPEKRDPDLMAKLDCIAGRVL